MILITIEELYFEWLCTKVGTHLDKGNYISLLKELYLESFQVLLPDDDNRRIDGINLKYLFEEETGYPVDEIPDSCSVLEMLIAMADREEQDVLSDGETNWTYILFWEMMNNLGLDVMTDDQFDPNYVLTIVINWMRRQYEPNGVGSIFHRAPQRRINYRRVSFWQQMAWYVSDNLI